MDIFETKNFHSALPFWQYQFPHANQVNSSQDLAQKSHSQYPSIVGTSVFALKYKDGVIIAADTVRNYGGLYGPQYPYLERIKKINETTVYASSGDNADFKYLHKIIENKQKPVEWRPESLYRWLTRVVYNRRSKFDPLWNTIIIGGFQDGKPFLGCVDHIGTIFKENAVATGVGAAMAIPIINRELKKYDNSTDNLNFKQAKEIMMKCLRLSNMGDNTYKFHISVINKNGTKVIGPLDIDSKWEVAKMIFHSK